MGRSGSLFTVPAMSAKPKRPGKNRGTNGSKVTERKQFELSNSTVILEYGPAGVIARIERPEWVDYAGPLPSETIEALAEVAH